MSIREELESKDYRKHVAEMYYALKRTNTLYQKRIADSKGTRYFINVWWYPADTINGYSLNEGWQYEIQLHTADDSHDKTVDVEWGKDRSLEESELLADELWKFMGGHYYETDDYL